MVTSFTENLITPLINIFGNAETFEGLAFEVRGQEFGYGNVIDALVSFLITAAVLFFFVVRPVNRFMRRHRTEPEVESPTRSCPECLSKIPTEARRCAFCTTEVATA